ncbi:DUF732 domain-containing protein [Actinoplanes aureus]|jgi:hypothetical protein|uniref:DUF732 domain-containing protein n=1 Tax=Actinoplanes aureus TaxID=2792083 RepID=A0A931FYV5_9ACTN|nr:DUF732 domain-containing protein [Actinoplanes aureus]MBG0562321.1 hypothetical protein [Actinoplanes aureus]
MRRFGLLVAAATVPMIAACGAPAGVPEWKQGQPAPAAPSATGSVPAPNRQAGAAAPSPAEAPAATPEPDVAATVASSAPGEAVSGERFLAAVRGQLPEVAVDRRPEEITEIGDAACTSLAAGQRRASAAADLIGYGVSNADARELVILARAFLCRT